MKANVLAGLYSKKITWLTSVFLSLTNLELMRKIVRKVYSRVILREIELLLRYEGGKGTRVR